MRVGIIGTGLIGSSIGLACRERGDEVLGFDRDTTTLKFASARGAIEGTASRDEIYENSDVVVIALPLDATIEEVHGLVNRGSRAEQVVIDVASVKAPVEKAGRSYEVFVPTHPMAGSERSGPTDARGDLFERRWWCYVPTNDELRTQSARAFIDRLGAYPCAVDASEHDRIVALTSHLPQLFAYAFTQCLKDLSDRDDARRVSALCGPVAQELLRIGQSSPQMWDPIFHYNAAEIADALGRLKKALDDRRLPG